MLIELDFVIANAKTTTVDVCASTYIGSIPIEPNLTKDEEINHNSFDDNISCTESVFDPHKCTSYVHVAVLITNMNLHNSQFLK